MQIRRQCEDKIMSRSVLDANILYCHSKWVVRNFSILRCFSISMWVFITVHTEIAGTTSALFRLSARTLLLRCFLASERVSVPWIVFVSLQWETCLTSQSDLIMFMLQLKRNPVMSGALVNGWLWMSEEWRASLPGQLLFKSPILIYRTGNWILALHK